MEVNEMLLDFGPQIDLIELIQALKKEGYTVETETMASGFAGGKPVICGFTLSVGAFEFKYNHKQSGKIEIIENTEQTNYFGEVVQVENELTSMFYQHAYHYVNEKQLLKAMLFTFLTAYKKLEEVK